MPPQPLFWVLPMTEHDGLSGISTPSILMVAPTMALATNSAVTFLMVAAETSHILAAHSGVCSLKCSLMSWKEGTAVASLNFSFLPSAPMVMPLAWNSPSSAGLATAPSKGLAFPSAMSHMRGFSLLWSLKK